MTAIVKILVTGYTNADSVAETGEERTQPTVTLVRDGDFIMVVDPGILPSQQLLIDKLAEENLTVNDVAVVCITHSHIDHYRNIGMFPEAKVLEHFGLWSKNSVEPWTENLTSNIQILRTPGHDYTDITVFVTTLEGVVAICGDVFWKEDYPKNPSDDIYATNAEELGHSREMIMRISDWIIPGHGDKFKVKKSLLQHLASQMPARKPVELVCKKCRMKMTEAHRCLCRPWLCFKCCECGTDCDNCACSHEK